MKATAKAAPTLTEIGVSKKGARGQYGG